MIFAFTIVAETRMAEISMQFRENATSVAPSYLWMIAVAVLIGVGIGGYRFYIENKRRQYCPKSLLAELCDANQINRAGKKMLHLIASNAAVDQPASLLLSEARFDAAMKSAANRAPLTPEQVKMLCMIRRRVFAIQQPPLTNL
ncbi:hypothetical protein Q31b_43620 [Novipirellula aureliae]|uniref:Uncharacterized protein n=1 Tax=Novipirellula aureliae TaxID=2527966 RepID=A0A5C6DN36_9BACT|nr:hypothetical protein [Novipirellula aureliae]TWU37574.1 hypothetical protein Q31b_43620 [Novipirellula aureliae]